MLSYVLKIMITMFIIIVGMNWMPALPLKSIVTQRQNTSSVNGVGTVNAVPDMAHLTVGVESEDVNVKKAQDHSNAVIQKLIENLKLMKIDEKDVKTLEYSVLPQYDYKQSSNRIISYRVVSSLSIKLRELGQVNEVIDMATAHGANSVGAVQFVVNEIRLKELQEEARLTAVKEAKEKAKGLAKSAGLKLGQVIDVQENSNGMPFISQSFVSAKMRGALEADTNLQAGSTQITSSITLSYEVR